MSTTPLPVLDKQSFTYQDEAAGFVAPIPREHAMFMGQALTVLVDGGGFLGEGVTPADLQRANQALKVLPGCIQVAEEQLRSYAGSEVVASGDDIQNPHVWINDDADSPADWTLVVELKHNDGYGWHIEFHGDRFTKIWSGS